MEMKPNGAGDTQSLSPSKSLSRSRSQKSSSSNETRRFFGRFFNFGRRSRTKKGKNPNKKVTSLQPDEKKDLIPSRASSIPASDSIHEGNISETERVDESVDAPSSTS